MIRRCMATQSATRIAAGVILKRNPVILRAPNAFEEAYAGFAASAPTVAYDASFFESDKTMPKRTDDSKMEQMPFAPRSTVADAAGDVKSLDRKLDRSVYLVVKKPRSHHAWQFPQGGIQADEALHEVCLFVVI
jgi:large subunit ribosomal protein L46